jgi:hypothetical protein
MWSSGDGTGGFFSPVCSFDVFFDAYVQAYFAQD